MELKQQFSEITTLIAKAKVKAYQAVNKELVNLYWNVGEYVSKQVAAKAWGKSVVKELADFIQISEPNVIGLPEWEKQHESMCEGRCSKDARRMSVDELRGLL